MSKANSKKSHSNSNIKRKLDELSIKYKINNKKVKESKDLVTKTKKDLEKYESEKKTFNKEKIVLTEKKRELTSKYKVICELQKFIPIEDLCNVVIDYSIILNLQLIDSMGFSIIIADYADFIKNQSLNGLHLQFPFEKAVVINDPFLNLGNLQIRLSPIYIRRVLHDNEICKLTLKNKLNRVDEKLIFNGQGLEKPTIFYFNNEDWLNSKEHLEHPEKIVIQFYPNSLNIMWIYVPDLYL